MLFAYNESTGGAEPLIPSMQSVPQMLKDAVNFCKHRDATKGVTHKIYYNMHAYWWWVDSTCGGWRSIRHQDLPPSIHFYLL